MNAEPEYVRLIRLHKRWADRYTILWMVFVVVLFGGIYFALEEAHADPAARSDCLILLAVLVIIATVWQAVGLGLARIHMVIKGIDPENLANRSRK